MSQDMEKEIAFLREQMKKAQSDLVAVQIELTQEKQKRMHLEYLREGAVQDVDFRRLKRENTELNILTAEMRAKIQGLEAHNRALVTKVQFYQQQLKAFEVMASDLTQLPEGAN